MESIMTPDEFLKSSPKYSKEIIDECLELVQSALITKKFHYNTTKTSHYFIIKMPINATELDLNTVAEKLKKFGWNCETNYSDYCGHGPFRSLKIRTDEVNPQTIEFKITA